MPVRELRRVRRDERSRRAVPRRVGPERRRGRRLVRLHEERVGDLAQRLEVLDDPRQLPGERLGLGGGELERGEVATLDTSSRSIFTEKL